MEVVSNKRLFIRNVPENVTSSELQETFTKYGNVKSVNINQRKNSFGDQPFFAYINIDISNFDLQKCIKDFAHKKWNGEYLEVQLAKESFLDRLKRERELESNNDGINLPKASENKSMNYTIEPSKEASVDFKRRNGKKSIAVTVSSSTYTQSDEPTRLNEKNKMQFRNATIKRDNEPKSLDGSLKQSDCKIVKNKFKTITKKIHINVFQNSEDSVPPNELKRKLKPKMTEADRKRVKSLADMRKEFKQQKSQIKMALANLDAKPNNKIIFDDQDLPGDNSILNKDTNDKIALFEDSDEDEESYINFEVKEQFQGEKGQKLLQLQSRFKNDKRFTMDAKFLEDENECSDEKGQNLKTVEDSTNNEEKQMQFQILQEVLGVQISKPSVNKESLNKKKGMLRFDPTQPEHTVFEIKAAKLEKATKKKSAPESDDTGPVNANENMPEVSSTKFYKVTENLKDIFQKDTGSFSILASYQNNISQPDHEVEDSRPYSSLSNNMNLKTVEDAFKHDSSSEDEKGNLDKAVNKNNQHTSSTVQEVQGKKIGKRRTWSDPFFFGEDDYRLQEGLDFIRRLEIEDKSEFVKLRRNLRGIVKTKVRNTQRKNKLFKKKLGGGKKRIKIKKALKR